MKNLSYISNNLIMGILLIIMSLISSNLQAQGYLAMSTTIGGSDGDGAFIKVVGGVTYIVGSSASNNYPVTNGSTNNGGTDIVFTKLNASGTVLSSKYIGGSGNDGVGSMQISGGFIYLFGNSTSPNYPVTNGSTNAGGRSLIVTKLDLNGSILFSTYIGGSLDEFVHTIQVENGEMYLFGFTNSSDYPVTNGSSFAGVHDFTITKLAANGNIIYSTYIGGSDFEEANKMQVENGNVYIFGTTYSTDYPVTDGSTNDPDFTQDFVVTRLNSSGAIVYSKYIGVDGDEYPGDMLVDNGNMYVAGGTPYAGYPVTDGSTLKGGWDMVITKINSSGNIIYSTLFGGTANGIEYASKIKMIGGELYLLGTSGSSNFPVTDGSTFSGGYDFTVTKFSAAGAVLFSTILGGSGFESPLQIDVESGNMYIVGTSPSSDYPVTNGSTKLGIPIKSDLVFTKINAAGVICYSTYLGGSETENPNTLQVENGEVYLGGDTRSYDYPVTTGTLHTGVDNTDIFVTKIKFCPTFTISADPVTPASQTACINGVVQQPLIGSTISVPSSSMPTIYRNGVASQQNAIYPNYQWQKANAPGGPWTDIPGAILINYSPSPSAIDQYYRRLAKQSPCCGSTVISTSTISSVLINANTAPVANAGGIFNTCPASTINIGGSPSASGGLPPYSYLWDNGASAIANPAVNPVNNTLYTLIVTDALGCKGIDQALVNTYAANAGPDISSCGDSTVRIGTLPIPGLVGVTYSWSAVPADPSMSCTNCAQPDVKPLVPTTYTLTLTIPKTGGGSCFTIDAVTVTRVPGPVTPNFAGTDRALCLGSTASIGTPAEPGFTYTWAPGNYLAYNGLSQTTFQPGNISMPTPNPITYYLTASKGGCTFIDSTIVSVIEARAGIDGCGPRYVGMGDRTPNINETYSWTKISGSGNFLGAINLPRVPVSASLPGLPTIYQLTVTYNGAICTDLVTVTDCGCGVDINVGAPSGCPSFGLSGGSVSLNAVAAGVGIDPASMIFTWSPAAGLSATTGSTVYLTDNVPRTYTVTVTSSIDPGFSCSKTIDVNNPAWTTPVFTAQDVSICSGTPVFIGQAPVAGYSYLWATVAGLSAYNVSNPTATTNITTNYPVTVTDVVSGCSTSDIATVTVLNTPANAGPDYVVCSNAVIQLGSPAQPNTTYSWSPATAPWQNGTNEFSAQPEVLIASNITFTLTATNTVTGCVTSDLINIVVNNTPVINAPDKTICFGSTDTIGVAALPGVIYSWTPAAGLSCTNCARPVASPSITTTYTVVGTYPGGCTATDNVIVTVSNPSFSIPDINYCPSAGAFALAPTAPSGMISYSWSPASLVTNATISNPNTLAPPPNTTTTYTLTVTDANGCRASDAVTIIPSISVPDGGSSRVMCLNTTTTLGAVTNLVTDVWSILSGPNISTAQLSCISCAQPVFTPTAIGSYVLNVSRTIAGCTSNSTVTITVTGFSLPAIGSSTICQNACVQIGTVPQSGTSYVWTPATGLSNPNIANPVACMTTGNTNYTLTAIGLNGCIATANVLVGVNPSLTPQITIPPVLDCLGDINHFFPAISPAGSYNYLWTPNDGSLSSIYVQNPQIYLTTVGTKQYRLTATNTITGCSNFADANLTVLSCTPILPIKLESFTAVPQNEQVKLEWKVSEEINAAIYTIEFSTNGRNFISIGSIAATNNRIYSLLHANPVNGINIYRLKTTDKDGKISYSDLRRVNYVKGVGFIKIYPNPAAYDIKIETNALMIKRPAVIRIIAMDGSIVKQKTVDKIKQVETMDLSGVMAGKYVVQIISDKEVMNKIIVVIR